VSELRPHLVGVGSIFAFGLVAFGFLCMGPVTLPSIVTACDRQPQSVFELAQTEHYPRHQGGDQPRLRLRPDFVRGKHYLEANDSAGNTFKARPSRLLIGTAVVGATTMIFSIILLLTSGLLHLSLTDAPVAASASSAAGRWSSGSLGPSMQAVTTGAYERSSSSREKWNLTQERADMRIPDGGADLHAVAQRLWKSSSP